MSNQLAVAVVLLPPAKTMDEIISLISHRPAAPTKLNTHNTLPHLTLAMGLLQESGVDTASSLLHKLVSTYGLPTINIIQSKNYMTPDNKQFSDLRAELSDELVQLHVETMKAFKEFFSYENVSTSMFISLPPVAETSTYWVSHYGDKRLPEDFHPHITLGEGVVEPLTKPIRFTADRLALCHLGTYCTCRKVLAEAIK